MTVPQRPASEQPETLLTWKRSSFSGEQGECVEIAALTDGGWLVRDSKNPDGPRLRFTAGEVRAFRLGVQAGEFD